MSTNLKSPTLQAKRQPFSAAIKAIPGLEIEATDAINDLVHAITETGKSGELTIKLKLKPVGQTGQVEVDAEVKVKTPAPTRAKVFMFSTPDNNLQRENPKQTTLEGLRTADQEAVAQSELRTAAPADDKQQAPRPAPMH